MSGVLFKLFHHDKIAYVMKCFLSIFLLFICCNSNYPTRKEIVGLINSKSKNEVMLGIYYAGESRDTFYVTVLVNHIHNSSIIHHQKFYGMSIHQGVITALTKITGLQPPNKVSYEIDSTNIVFYKSRLGF
jgi:hypothetical protein